MTHTMYMHQWFLPLDKVRTRTSQEGPRKIENAFERIFRMTWDILVRFIDAYAAGVDIAGKFSFLVLERTR